MGSTASEYHKPTNVDEALRLLRRRSVRSAPLAGGTGILAQRLAGVEALVDLGGLGLDYIHHDSSGVQIGATTTLQAVMVSPLLATYAGGLLAKAAHHTATRTVRNVATVGGCVAGSGSSTDIVVALLALDAAVVAAAGETASLGDVLASDIVAKRLKLLVEFRLPPATGWRCALLRVARLPSDQAIVNVAALLKLEGDVCVDIRLAAGGIGPKPLRLHTAEGILRGTRLSDNIVDQAAAAQRRDVKPPTDVRGSSEYRRAMLGVLLQRAMHECRSQETNR